VRYGILGDIHSNLEALDGVLADVQTAGADRVLCVGDVVGYGANPRECIELMREQAAAVVAGNHDWASADRMGLEYFNSDARDSIEWTREQLRAEDAQYLGGLPLTDVHDEITLVHSTPFSPEYFDYVQTLYDVEVAFDHLRTRVCFVGHSHVPVMFVDRDPVDCFLEPELDLPRGRRLIVNVGSVGQPRDQDPRACYALYDTEEKHVQIRRVEYDRYAASARMVAAGLPVTNSNRIILGR
jgi:diadenosine tetraphosphatase ApaH/serine/threonine PP2A family protein phosphatase